MKKFVVSTLLLLLSIMEGFAQVSGVCGADVSWTLGADDVLVVSGTGNMDDYTYGATPSFAGYGSRIKSVVIEEGVTGIGISAFSQCTKITSVTIPSTMKTIGAYAFYGCNNLTGVYISDLASWCGITFNTYSNPLFFARRLFIGGEELTDLVFPESVTTVSNGAFANCNSITSVTIHEGMEFGEGVFSWCENIKTVVYLPGCTKTFAFGASSTEEIVLPESITEIGESSFQGWSKLSSITLPSGVTTIGRKAFSSCQALTEIAIPDGVSVLHDWTFESCSSLRSVDFGHGVTTIEGYAFSSCKGFEDVIIPENVTTIADYAFTYCDNIKTLSIGSGLTNVGPKAFQYVTLQKLIIGEGTATVPALGIKDVETVVLGEGVKAIAGSAFEGCGSLQNINFPSSLETVGHKAFRQCKKLLIPDLHNVRTIDAMAFDGCIGSSEVDLTSCVSVREYAFRSCSDIRAVVIGKDLERLSSATFDKCDNIDVLTYAEGCTHALSASLQNVSQLTLASTIETIDDYAFNNYVNLQTVELPASLKSIGVMGFSRCANISELHFPDHLETIGKMAFEGLDKLTILVFPNSVKSIGEYAFQKCTSLKSVTVGTGMVSISNNAFKDVTSIDEVIYADGCTKTIATYLTTASRVVIPASVIEYDNDSFRGFSKMTEMPRLEGIWRLGGYCFSETSISSAAIPDCVTEFAGGIFYGCKKLTEVTLPEAMTDIPDFMFTGTALTHIDLPENITSIGRYAFGSTIFKSITLPDGVTKIGDGAFSGAAIEEINLPEGIRSIEVNTFRQTPLKKLVLPPYLTSVGEHAFFFCTKLEELTIPASLHNIGYDFHESLQLLNITNLATTPQTISNQTFSVYGTLHVLPGCKSKYEKKTYWKNFTIVEDAVDPTGIETVVSGSTEGDHQAYDLLGRPVSDSHKGVVIKAGRKFLNK